MAKLIFVLVLVFITFVAAYPSPQDLIQSLPERVKRAPSPNPGPEHLHHYETTTRDRFGNTRWSHEDVIHPDPWDFGYGGHGHSNHFDDYHGHHHHHDHFHGHHGLFGGIFDFFG